MPRKRKLKYGQNPQPTALEIGQLWFNGENFLLIVKLQGHFHWMWLDTDEFHMKVTSGHKGIAQVSQCGYECLGRLGHQFTRDLRDKLK